MNSVSRRRSRISLVAMIVGGLLAVAPVFGPLGKTLHYLADFIAERPQPMRAPDISFFVELLALIICPVGLLLFAISLVLFIRSGRPTAPPRMIATSASNQSMKPTTPHRITTSKLVIDPCRAHDSDGPHLKRPSRLGHGLPVQSSPFARWLILCLVSPQVQ